MSYRKEYLNESQVCKYDIYGNVLLSLVYKQHKDIALSKITNSGLAIFLLVMTPFGIFGNLYLLAVLYEYWHCFKCNMVNGVRFFKNNVKFYLKFISFCCLFLCILFLFWSYYYLTPGCGRENGTFAYMIWLGKVEWVLEEAIICSVNYVMALMCFDTFLSLRCPFFYRNNYANKNKALKIVVLGLAIYSFLIVLPFLFYFVILSNSPLNPGLLEWHHHVMGYKINQIHTNLTTISTFRHSKGQLHENTYFLYFNEKIIHFSMRYDAIETILTHVIPCTLIFGFNALTIYLFIVRERKSSAKISTKQEVMAPIKKLSVHIPENFILDIPTTFEDSKPGMSKTKTNSVGMVDSYLTLNKLSTNANDRVRQIKDRNKNIVILTSLLSLITLIFSIPWITYVLISSLYWNRDFKVFNMLFQTVAHDLVFTKFYIFPYLILLGDTNVRKKFRKIFLKYTYDPIVKMWEKVRHIKAVSYLINNKVNV
ncbi:unnamed protein product [Gordionus sp. m RMFG-2023]